MSLALFDLDNTLIAGDSDYLWNEYLAEAGIIDAEAYQQKNHLFYEQYKDGCLDIEAYLSFALSVLKTHKHQDLLAWRQAFIEEKIKPLLLPKAKALLKNHQDKGDTLVIITATNRFITEPIAKYFNVDTLIAVEPEMVAGEFTGAYIGTPTFREGKVICLGHWMASKKLTYQGSSFYSDSHNDLPLLNKVSNPVAVDPDDKLREHAESHGWPIISLRS